MSLHAPSSTCPQWFIFMLVVTCFGSLTLVFSDFTSPPTKKTKLRWYPQQPQLFIFTNLSEACCKAKRWKHLSVLQSLPDLLRNLLRNPVEPELALHLNLPNLRWNLHRNLLRNLLRNPIEPELALHQSLPRLLPDLALHRSLPDLRRNFFRNPVLPSTTLYYKARSRCFPVLLCTTKLARSTSQYYSEARNKHFQYYFVLLSLHEVLPSTTLYYKACTKDFPVLLYTTKLAQSTCRYYFIPQSLHKALPSTTLHYSHYKACTKHFPVLLCTTKLAQGISQYYFALQSLHKGLPSTK